jgi:hypothetical protein
MNPMEPEPIAEIPSGMPPDRVVLTPLEVVALIALLAFGAAVILTR